MPYRGLAVFAALALLAACETPGQPDTAGGAAGSGAGGGMTTGAPTTPVAASALEAQTQIERIGDTVFFGFDQYTLDGPAQTTIGEQARLLASATGVAVVIEGHTDERGTREYNLALGDRRANAVRDYMVSLGVDPMQIRTISYGEERPAVAGSNDAAWARNRRAVTIVPGARPGT